MKHLQPLPRSKQGMLLLELILALTIFSIAVVSLTQALNAGLEASAIMAKENEVHIGLRSFVEEMRRKAVADMATETTDDQLGVTYSSTVDELSLKNLDGTVLTDLYVLHAKAAWGEGSDAHEESVDLYLYEPQGQNINGTPASATAASGTATTTGATSTAK